MVTPRRRAPRRTPAPTSREVYRDDRGRFRKATEEERFASDVRAGTAAYFAGRAAGQRQQFSVFEGRLSGRQFAIRRGRAVPLDAYRLAFVIDSIAGAAAQFFHREVVITSPVDTGLLRSRWRLAGDEVDNDTPYLPQVMRRNPFVSNAFEETQFFLQQYQLPTGQQGRIVQSRNRRF